MHPLISCTVGEGAGGCVSVGRATFAAEALNEHDQKMSGKRKYIFFSMQKRKAWEMRADENEIMKLTRQERRVRYRMRKEEMSVKEYVEDWT